jgi:hypothetical protein
MEFNTHGQRQIYNLQQKYQFPKRKFGAWKQVHFLLLQSYAFCPTNPEMLPPAAPLTLDWTMDWTLNWTVN